MKICMGDRPIYWQQIGGRNLQCAEWLLEGWLLCIRTVCVCMTLYVHVLLIKENNIWLHESHVNNIFKIAQKRTAFVALISKSISLWDYHSVTRQLGEKVGLVWCLCSSAICFCLHVHVSAETCLSACDHVCARLRVCSPYFVQTSSIVTRVFCVHFVLHTDPVPGRR